MEQLIEFKISSPQHKFLSKGLRESRPRGESARAVGCEFYATSWIDICSPVQDFWRLKFFQLGKVKPSKRYLHTVQALWAWVRRPYRVKHQVGLNLRLTSKEKFRFGLACPDLARQKRNFSLDVNGRFEPTWCVTLYWLTANNHLKNATRSQIGISH